MSGVDGARKDKSFAGFLRARPLPEANADRHVLANPIYPLPKYRGTGDASPSVATRRRRIALLCPLVRERLGARRRGAHSPPRALRQKC
jgi:hypothetical protein